MKRKPNIFLNVRLVYGFRRKIRCRSMHLRPSTAHYPEYAVPHCRSNPKIHCCQSTQYHPSGSAVLFPYAQTVPRCLLPFIILHIACTSDHQKIRTAVLIGVVHNIAQIFRPSASTGTVCQLCPIGICQRYKGRTVRFRIHLQC